MIRQRADVGQGGGYHHFSGKTDLALTAIQRCAKQTLGDAEQHLATPGTAFERIESLLRNQGKGLQDC